MAIRLIASDLDGTLFGKDSVPEARTVAAMHAVVDAGMIFVAVTGRSHFGGADRVVSTGGTAHWFIGSNGGHRLNMSSRVLEERLLFEAPAIQAMLNEMQDNLDGIGFGLEHDAGFTFDAGFKAVFPNAFDGGPRRDTTEHSLSDIGKVFIAHPEMGNHEMIAYARRHLPDDVVVTTSGTGFAEITPAGADKAQGLERLCNQLDISCDEVVAFGDNNNDITMLSWAGRGIAMANATDQAKDAADEITASNTDFGVAQVLESLA